MQYLVKDGSIQDSHIFLSSIQIAQWYAQCKSEKVKRVLVFISFAYRHTQVLLDNDF